VTLRRKAIRLAIVEAIKAAVPEFEDRVYPHRVLALRETHLPCAVVLGEGEAVEEIAGAPVWHRRTARFLVHIAAGGLDEVEDALDELGQKVEDALWRDEDLHADTLISRLRLTTVVGPLFSDEGSEVFGDLQLGWEITYEGDPLADHDPEDDFATLHAEIDSSASREGPEAEADIELEVATP
jgi:hypothetical protein